MTRNTRSEWHAGGTSTPSSWKREGSVPEISGPDAIAAVPLRATHGSADPSEPAETRGFWRSTTSSGTEWHDGPEESVRVHGRAQ